MAGTRQRLLLLRPSHQRQLLREPTLAPIEEPELDPEILDPNHPLFGKLILRDLIDHNNSGQILVNAWVRLTEFMGYPTVLVLTYNPEETP